MATYYLWSGATGSATGADWTNAYTAWSSVPSLSSGDIVKIHTGTSPHSQTTGTYTFNGPFSGLPAYIIGVDKDNSDAYLAATTTIFSNSDPDDISFDGSIIVFGIRFTSGDKMTLAAGDSNELSYFQDCRFDCQTDTISFTGGTLVAKDCDFVVGSAGFVSQGNGITTLYGGSITGSSTYSISITYGRITIIGADLSGITGSQAFNAPNIGIIRLIGCVLPSSFTMSSVICSRLEIFESDNATSDSQWRNETIGTYVGDMAVSATVYRDGGGTYDGTNEYSYKLSTGSLNIVWSPVSTRWNTGYIAADSGTQTTWTVYIANTNADTDNDEVWLEVEYFGNASSTQKIIASTGLSDYYDTPSTNTDDTTNTWTGITEFAQKISYTGTVTLSGMYRWRVCSTYATDVYVCPKADVTQA